MSAKIKLKKTLYIGLGGTGAATLLRVKKCFIDSYGEIPPMIGFLAIDTDTAAYNKEVTSNLGRPIKLTENELLVCSVRNSLATYKNNPKVYDWVPTDNVSKLSSIAGNGAGQVRSNGRFIAYYNYKTIDDNIKSAITSIHQLIPQDSPYAVDTNKNGVEYLTTINVISSLAGGTGSGMIVDVLCLINKAMEDLALQYDLYPWLVLPEVFRAMSSGPSMSNVLYNTYGALRTLDYIEHLDPQKGKTIDFGYKRIEERIFRYAYLINNLNQSGVAFDKLDDVLDVIAKSAFLPANKMGDDLTSPFDNIKNQQDGGVYDIHNKKAWAASAGSAELIYDSQAVGRGTAYRTISQLCESMIGSVHSGVQNANDFVDHQDVMIRENNGRDDVINALANAEPQYSINIDEHTTIDDINIFIADQSGDKLDNSIEERFNAKLSKVKDLLHKRVAELLDQTTDGCLGVTTAFLQSLKTIINLCNDEMKSEQKDFNTLNSQPAQWETYLNAVPKTGLGAIFGRKVDEDAVDALQQELRRRVVNLREEQRRLWAIRFYNDLTNEISVLENSLGNLKSHIGQIQVKYRDELLAEQQRSASTSKFQIFLHQTNVEKLGMFNIDTSVKANFHQHFQKLGGLVQWLTLSREQIDAQLLNFAKGTNDVLNAVNTNIDDVLRRMKTSEVEAYLNQLKVLAAPLWTYNTQGYQSEKGDMDRFVVVGVGNRNNSFLSSDPAFNAMFDTNGNKASFASTNQNDRIYVLVVEDLLPIYAVNNFSTYERDYDIKVTKKIHLAAHIDEKLYNRMNSENFSIMPVIEKDNMLELWVQGFVFGFIHFDSEQNQYWIRSKSKGSAIHGYRFNLNQRRDVAFDIFKSEGLYKEIENLMKAEILAHGEEPIKEKIAEIKNNENYLDDYANLSPLERANIEHPNFASVLRLIEQEIGLMTN